MSDIPNTTDLTAATEITVILFARFRDVIGRDTIPMTLPSPATVQQLRDQFAKAYPTLRDLLERTRVAVDNEFAADDHLLTSQCEIALIPPVSGG